MALSVSADMLLFGQDERGPDDDLRLQFEAASRLDREPLGPVPLAGVDGGAGTGGCGWIDRHVRKLPGRWLPLL